MNIHQIKTINIHNPGSVLPVEINIFKGTVSERFFASGFFHESPSPKPLIITLGSFRKFAEIFACQGAPPVSLTPVANLPPVSTTSAANFATSSPCVDDTGGK
jgi:hypothetical protein